MSWADGTTGLILNGESLTGYSETEATPQNIYTFSCEDVAGTLTCEDEQIFGGASFYDNPSCLNVNCTLPRGSFLLNGESET